MLLKLKRQIRMFAASICRLYWVFAKNISVNETDTYTKQIRLADDRLYVCNMFHDISVNILRV